MPTKILLFLCFFYFNVSWSRTVVNVACSRSSDSLVLVKIFQSTDGPNWISKWPLNQNMSTWFGVSLNQSGCVTQLNLSNNGLKGSLPDEIGLLGSLRQLFLFTNNISGSIPGSIGSLTELEEMNFEGNFFSGAIPAGIGSLSKLKLLSLASNFLQFEIPDNLFNLINLTRLSLAHNQLAGSIPSVIGQLKQLQVLDLSENKFTGNIPESISTLTLLKDLFLNDNSLSGEPPGSMFNLIYMVNLWLNNNKFTGAVPDLTNSDLLSLRLENNFFTSIPDYSVVKTWGRVDPLGLVMYNNYFTFEDLIPLLALPRNINWNFKPQRPIKVDSIQYVEFGTNYAIKLFTDPGILDNNYKWFKDTSVLTITNQNFFQIIQFKEKDEGYYYGSIVNQLFSDFSIQIPYIRILGFNSGKCDVPLAGKSCNQAPIFCNTNDIHSYCGNMNISDGIVRASFCDPVNDLENPRYVKFTASSDSIVLEIFPMSCSNVLENEIVYTGMQAAILDACDTTVNSSLFCQNECQEKPFLIGGKGFVKGNEYTLVVDGCHGSNCNYLIKVRAGRNFFELIPQGTIIGEQVFCPDTLDHVFKINKIEGATRYEWKINDTLRQASNDTFYNVKNFTPGIYKVAVKAFANCDTTNEIAQTFRVFPKMEVNDFKSDRLFRDSVYQIYFKITGGTAPYTLVSGFGTLDSITGQFTSNFKICKSNYFYEIWDKWNCSIIISGHENCSCDSYAGTIPSEPLIICGEENIFAKNNNDFIKDTGDVSTFIFCSDSTKPSTTVLRISQSGVIPFDISKFKFDSTYYLVFVIGRSNGLGQINFNHPCTSYSNFQSVVFRRKSLVSAGPDNSICINNTNLNGFGNFVKSRWSLLSGPKMPFIETPDSSSTQVVFDSIGTYTFLFQASNDYCLSTDEVKISYDTIYRPVISGITSLCGNKETVLDVGEQLTYKWSTGDTTRTIKVNTSGKYCVTVTNSENCSGDTCVNISITPSPSFSILGNNRICVGTNTLLQASQDFAQYKWSTGASTKAITVDVAGSYCLTVTNSFGCTGTSCQIVSLNSASTSTKNDSSCNKSLYSFKGKLYDVPGNYQITLVGANRFGCDSVINLNLFSYPLITLLDSVNLPDKGNSSGSISLIFKGGVAPLQYLWSNGAKTASIANLNAGTYTLTVYDTKNCTFELTFVVKSAVGTTQSSKTEDIEVHPNPLNQGEQLFWNAKDLLGQWTIEIYSANGTLISRSKTVVTVSNQKNSILLETRNDLLFFCAKHESGKIFFRKILCLN
ncbi:MAG: leucine-rich repeat domain-containing protein [Saprospiraceae bacterium]